MILCIVNNCNHLKSTGDRYSHYACNISIDSCTRLAKTINITNQIYNNYSYITKNICNKSQFWSAIESKGFL